MGEELTRVLTWPFDKMIIPEEDTSSSETASIDTGAAASYESTETQAAQRRLARLSKYFTSPTGVLDSSTGSAGVL